MHETLDVTWKRGLDIKVNKVKCKKSAGTKMKDRRKMRVNSNNGFFQKTA